MRDALHRSAAPKRCPVVEIDSDEIQRRADLLHVARLILIAVSGRNVSASGYRPRSAGSRNQMFVIAWARSAASLSASELVAGSHDDMLNAVPTRAVGRAAFNARNPAPCARFTTCVARRKSSRLVSPRSMRAFQIAEIDEGCGFVEHHPVRNAVAQFSAQPTPRSRQSAPAVSRLGHPPASSSACGKSQ